MGYDVADRGAHLSIGIFETNQRMQALLRDLLSLAGHQTYTCGKKDQPLRAFLDDVLVQINGTGTIPYDLLILNVAATELIGDARISLEHLARTRTLPVVLLTDPTELEPFRSNMPLAPVLFHSIFNFEDLFLAIEKATNITLLYSEPLLLFVLQRQREHHQRLIKAEEMWLDQRREWAAQRQQWLDQRGRWLRGRQIWLDVQRHRPYPQSEWLDEQQQWVLLQMEDLRLQLQWLLDRQYWLRTYQKRLSAMKQHCSFSDFRRAL